MRIANFYDPGCDVMDFEINFMFLIEPSFYMTKRQDKKLNILRTESAFRVKKSIFHHFLKGFQLSKIVSDLRVHL